ncbi:MAG: 2-oxoacid:acceptor oxidoreductase family protein [Phycisphaerae bacterium]|nr:2-oxoacid:acceptor oxidoreductase family protein [Phycisphaerae bacterium]
MSYKLAATDDLGFCHILLSALGGDGANMAAKLLFKIGCTEFGLDGGYDARYGSEKKGTPTDVSVRFCAIGTAIRQSGPTNTPHFLVVFHADLIVPLELGRGLYPGAVCIVNTVESPRRIRDRLRLHSGKLVCVDATRIAFETRSRLNMPLLAVLSHELRFPDELVKQKISRQWPAAVERNLASFDRALQGVQTETYAFDGAYSLARPSATRGPIGWRNMLNGGTVDALYHTTAGRDNRVAARGRVPEFEPESCTSCGICLTVCSDPGGLLWKEGRMVGIDDRFCKGCMRCVEVCPETKKGKALTVPNGNGHATAEITPAAKGR